MSKVKPMRSRSNLDWDSTSKLPSSPGLGRSQRFILAGKPTPISATSANAGANELGEDKNPAVPGRSPVSTAGKPVEPNRNVVFLKEMRGQPSKRASLVAEFRRSMKRLQDSENNVEKGDIERRRRLSVEEWERAKGPMECISASSRAISGRLANAKLFSRFIGLIKVFNAIVALAAVGAFSFDANGNNNLRVLAAVLLTCYCFETGVKFLALGRGYLYFWMNVWDAVVLTVAVTLAVDRLDSAVYVIVLIGRCLRNGKVIVDAIKTTNMMCKLLNGESVNVKQMQKTDFEADIMPYTALSRLLHKAKFTAHFSKQEIREVDYILEAINSNKLFSPNLDRMLKELGRVEDVGGEEFAAWVKQNVKPTDTYSHHSASSAETQHKTSVTSIGDNESIADSCRPSSSDLPPRSSDFRKVQRRAKAAWNRPGGSPMVGTPLDRGMDASSRESLRSTVLSQHHPSDRLDSMSAPTPIEVRPAASSDNMIQVHEHVSHVLGSLSLSKSPTAVGRSGVNALKPRGDAMLTPMAGRPSVTCSPHIGRQSVVSASGFDAKVLSPRVLSLPGSANEGVESTHNLTLDMATIDRGISSSHDSNSGTFSSTAGPVGGDVPESCGSWQSFMYPFQALEDVPKLPNNPYLQYMSSKHLNSWGFNVFKFAAKAAGEPLAVMFKFVIDAHGLAGIFSISENVLVSYGRAIEAQYHKPDNIPYHNSEHAADVLQSTHVLLAVGGLGGRISDLDRLSILIAALAHDVGHPGVNNSYLVNTEDNEALLRNDQSVLEHMHSFICFNTMRHESLDVLGSLNVDQRKRARSNIIALILGTDLQQHFEILCRFKGRFLDPVKADAPAHDDNGGVLLQMQIALKIADISHPTKPWEQHLEWTKRCMNEFFLQGDREKAAGLQVSSLMDREATRISQAQIGFINVLVRPLFSAWSEVTSTKWETGATSHTPFPSEKSSTAAAWQSPKPSSGSALATSSAGVVLCKTIEGFLNANVAQWQALEDSGSTSNLDLTATLQSLEHSK